MRILMDEQIIFMEILYLTEKLVIPREPFLEKS